MVELPFCPDWTDIESDYERDKAISKANYLNSLALEHAFSVDKGFNGIKVSDDEIAHVIYEVCGIKRTDYIANDNDITIINKCTFDWYVR